jgi:hypothetical protein
MRSMMVMAMLAVPSIALAQSKEVVVELRNDDEKPEAAKPSDSNRKLAQLEARLEAMLREIQAMRAGQAAASAGKAQARVVEKSSEARHTAIHAAQAGKAQAQKGEPAGIILRMEPQAQGQHQKTEAKGVVVLEMSGLKIETDKGAKGDKHAKEGQPIEIQGKLVIVGDDGKPGPQGTTYRIETAPLKHQEGVKVVGTKIENKELTARMVPGSEGKFIIELVEDKKGDHPKVLVVGEPKQPAHGTITKTATGIYIAENVGGPQNAVNLTRVTYTLNPERARALDSFLKANANAKVLETKVEGDKFVVTTTPDVQSTIGKVVALISGHTGNVKFMIERSPTLNLRIEGKPETKPHNPDDDD